MEPQEVLPIEINYKDAEDFACSILEKILKKQNTLNFSWRQEQLQLFENMLNYSLNKKGDFDLSKGILLLGKNGTGKSTFMKVFSVFSRKIKNKPFVFTSCQSIIDQIDSTKDLSVIPDWYKVSEVEGFCFDEIGKEYVRNIFGSKSDPINQILTQRANKNLLTHGTTNLTLNGFKEAYGKDLFSRIHGMFNFFEMTGDDNRMV